MLITAANRTRSMPIITGRLRRNSIHGPSGTEPLLDTIAASPSLATLVGEQTRITWPAEWDLRRIAVHDPAPVYPHALIWRAYNPHPALTALRDYLGPQRSASPGAWAPSW
jgi:hypothetical protein